MHCVNELHVFKGLTFSYLQTINELLLEKAVTNLLIYLTDNVLVEFTTKGYRLQVKPVTCNLQL